MPKTLDIQQVLDKDRTADLLSNKFVTWSNSRVNWENTVKETHQYLYATSTNDIMNITRPWDNTTHIPKITQMRELLKTYYLDAIFNLPDYVEWEPYSASSATINQKNGLKALIKELLNRIKFKKTIEQLIEDYIDFGNCFATIQTVNETGIGLLGEKESKYAGPKAFRIDPMSIYFDPTAINFQSAPKIIRTVMTLGELAAAIEDLPEEDYMKKAFQRAIKNRQTVKDLVAGGFTGKEVFVNDDLNIAGFGNLSAYLCSDAVELLTFYGDLFDTDSNKLARNQKIVIMDRNIVLEQKEADCPIFKCGWRDRKNTLWSMGPFDNVVGMQYMIDFLENKRADIFNFIANPVYKTIGDVEVPDYIRPGDIINCDRDADFVAIRPDTTALAADTYVDRYMAMIEEFVGMPREAMGFRTPGEKTAFEVQQLSTAGSRIFERQVHKFEDEMLEPLINYLLKMYIASNAGQVIMLPVKNQFGGVSYEEFNLSDIDVNGKFYAVGSRTYTEKARLAQTLMQLGNSGLYMDELVRNNLDPKVIAAALIDTTGLDKFDNILKENARVYAAAEMQSQVNYAQEGLDEQAIRSIDRASQANV